MSETTVVRRTFDVPSAAEFGRDYFVYGGVRYEAHAQNKTYGDALTACGLRGGNLVEIFDAELNAVVVGGIQQLVDASLQGQASQKFAGSSQVLCYMSMSNL